MLLTASGTLTAALFPQNVEALECDFEKLGEHRYVYRMLFRLYEAALFTTPGATAEDVLNADTAFHLKFRYLRKIDKRIILKSADRMLQKNLTAPEQAAIAERAYQINQAYTSVRQGDVSSLTYRPGIGTTLMINGEPVVTIQGKDFGQLYFRIWLGKQPISTHLKHHLLGKG